jgi:hypothetical protein
MKQKTKLTIRAAVASGPDAVLALVKGPHSYGVNVLRRQATSSKLTAEQKAISRQVADIAEGKQPDSETPGSGRTAVGTSS